MGKFFLVIQVLLVSSLISCGGKTGGSNKSKEDQWKEFVDGNTPKFLVKAQNNCGVGIQSFSDLNFSFSRYFESRDNFVTYDLENQFFGNIIQSNNNGPIKTSLYDSEMLYGYDYKWSDEYKNYEIIKEYDFITENAGNDLFICENSGTFTGNFYESAGLNISQVVTQTFNKIKEADPEIKIDPITVHVGLKFKLQQSFLGGANNREIKSQYRTDNAFYFGRDKILAFLPESEEAAMAAPLWEIPMVGAHEYGHHVFNTLISSKIGHVHDKVGSCFKENKLESLLKNHYFEDRDKSHENFTLRAMNEGFADLIAFYTNSKSERSLDGVECMENNRDLNSSTYGDGTKKYFSYTAQIRMDSSYNYGQDSDCNTPDFQAIHEVGASFAYIMDQIISLKASTQKEKLQLLLKWTNKFSEVHPLITKKEPSAYIKHAVEIMAVLINNEVGTSSKNIKCEDINQHFAGYDCEIL